MTEVAEVKPEGEKLWAGKYRTPEEMEEAIAGKDKEYVKLKQTHDALANSTRAPDNYRVPDNIGLLQSEIDSLKNASKNANLSQEGFETLVQDLALQEQQRKDTYAEKLKEVGTENVTLLEDYVKKTYPEQIQETVLKQLVLDKDARAAALKHRNNQLDSRAPGMNEGNPGANKPAEAYDGQQEVMKLAQEQLRKPHDQKLRDKLINKAREVGEARFKK